MGEGRWRDLPPLPDAERSLVQIGEPDEDGESTRISQTFLRTHDRCERAAFLYAKHEGGAGSHAMDRGSLFHEFAARAIRHLIAHEEQAIDRDSAQDLLLEVFTEHPEFVVPAGERKSLRMMVENFASSTFFAHPEETIVAIENAFTLRIGKWVVRGRIDLGEMRGPARLDLTDYKTSLAMLTQEQFEGDFQTTLYALAAAFGELEETGLSIGSGVEQFGLHQVYPRYTNEQGMVERFFMVDRSELTEFRLDLEAQLTRLESNIESGKWQAVPGSHCSECTSPNECPLPRHLRPDSQLAVASLADAEKVAWWLLITGDRTRRAKARLKAFANAEGLQSIDAGPDYEFSFSYGQAEEIKDRAAMFANIEGAVNYGHPFDPADHVTTKKSTKFEKRKKVKAPNPEEEMDG